MAFKGDASILRETFRSHHMSATKSISGPMLLAAHWQKQARQAVRIQVTVVNKDLPLPSFRSVPGYKRRK